MCLWLPEASNGTSGKHSLNIGYNMFWALGIQLKSSYHNILHDHFLEFLVDPLDDLFFLELYFLF